MAQYRKKPVVIEATQWFKNGDHPQDRWSDEGVLPEGAEGNVVRYFRTPAIDGNKICDKCNKSMQEHGWIDTLEGGHIVCHGDWIITGVAGEHYPCKPEIFEATYDKV